MKLWKNLEIWVNKNNISETLLDEITRFKIGDYSTNFNTIETLRKRVLKYDHEKQAFIDFNGEPVLDKHYNILIK